MKVVKIKEERKEKSLCCCSREEEESDPIGNRNTHIDICTYIHTCPIADN